MILASATPTGWALSLAAALAYAAPAAAGQRLAGPQVRAVLAVAWCLHAALLVHGLLADPPRFGFAPALSITAWLVLTVYVVESQLFPHLRARWTLAGLGAIAIVLARLFPGTPVHGGSAWLPLHWALGIASYGLFASAVVHAWLMTRAEQAMRQAAETRTGLPLLTLERLTFRFVAVGFGLLSATLLAGWLFGGRADGGGWRWDHKTVFSLLSWLTFAALLVGRARFGWRGRRAVRMVYAGALLLMLAYVGSRFVIEVLLGRA